MMRSHNSIHAAIGGTPKFFTAPRQGRFRSTRKF